MIVVVTGTRRHARKQAIAVALHAIGAGEGDTLYHGKARGVDLAAGSVATSLKMEVVPVPVDTAIDGPWPAAGCKRNGRMLRKAIEKAKSTPGEEVVVLAFPCPESRGAWDCVSQARALSSVSTVRVIPWEVRSQ